MATWSYSSINLFKQCPRKYYHLRIAKDVVEPEAEHLIYGNAVHKALEDYGRLKTPIPEKFSYIKPYIDALLGIEGDKYFEHKMGLRSDHSPCGFFDNGVWWRGIADFLLVRDNGTALLIDYKTGKNAKYADTQQLELLSLAVFSHFPEVNEIDAGLLFVVSKDLLTVEVRRDDAEKLWKPWIKVVDKLDEVAANDTWNPAPNFTCRKHCPVVHCEYNGRN